MFKEYAFKYENINFDEYNIPKQQTRLLDLSKDEFDLLETFVKQTAEYHLSQLNNTDNLNLQHYYIEFWWKSEIDLSGLHVDCDEHLCKNDNKYVYPLLSCLSYFNDLECYPTILTNIDLDKYIFKEFDEESMISLVYPKKNRQITFDGSFYHGVLNDCSNSLLPERKILAINLWNVCPKNVEYYESESITVRHKTIIESIENSNIQNIYLPKSVFNANLFEQFLYKKNLKLDLSKHLSECNRNIIKLLKEDEKQINNVVAVKQSQIFLDIKNVNNCNNRFHQRFIKQRQFTPDVCDWIVYEAEKYASVHGWTTRRHNKYPTTDLPADVLKNVFGYLLFAMKDIISFIKKSYQIEDANVDVKDLFIVKYENMKQNLLEFHTDGSLISFNIALNSMDEYQGGGTCFEDGIVYKQDKGDMIVHSSLVKHAGATITSGKRFILVGFLDITDKAI